MGLKDGFKSTHTRPIRDRIDYAIRNSQCADTTELDRYKGDYLARNLKDKANANGGF